MKKEYNAPEVKALGSFESLTQAAQNGTRLDATYAINTPEPELTFS